jgi:tryptophanyl-tRNA synthetase
VPVFTYLDAFGKDKAKIAELKEHYQRGGLGDSTVKKYLLETLLAFLDPIRKAREQFAKDPKHIMELLKLGTEAAITVSHKTLVEVRKAMGINYF